MKKFWDIASTVFVWTVVAVAVAMMIFTIVSVNTFNRDDRSIFGYSAFIVLSDSMSATDFDAGDLVLIRKTAPDTLQEGDIITYRSQNAWNYGENVTHKIYSRTTTASGQPGFITYGTTTGIHDEGIVTYPFVVGKYVGAIPRLGNFFQFLRTPKGYICCILIPFLLLIGYQGINCVRLFQRYKDEQMAELEAQRSAIEDERKKSEEALRQLQELKAQFSTGEDGQTLDVAAMAAELAALRSQIAQKGEEQS